MVEGAEAVLLHFDGVNPEAPRFHSGASFARWTTEAGCPHNTSARHYVRRVCTSFSVSAWRIRWIWLRAWTDQGPVVSSLI